MRKDDLKIEVFDTHNPDDQKEGIAPYFACAIYWKNLCFDFGGDVFPDGPMAYCEMVGKRLEKPNSGEPEYEFENTYSPSEDASEADLFQSLTDAFIEAVGEQEGKKILAKENILGSVFERAQEEYKKFYLSPEQAEYRRKESETDLNEDKIKQNQVNASEAASLVKHYSR